MYVCFHIVAYMFLYVAHTSRARSRFYLRGTSCQNGPSPLHTSCKVMKAAGLARAKDDEWAAFDSAAPAASSDSALHYRPRPWPLQ